MNRYGQKLQQDPNTIGVVAGSNRMNGNYVPVNKTNANNSTIFSHYTDQQQSLPPKAQYGKPPMMPG